MSKMVSKMPACVLAGAVLAGVLASCGTSGGDSPSTTANDGSGVATDDQAPDGADEEEPDAPADESDPTGETSSEDGSTDGVLVSLTVQGGEVTGGKERVAVSLGEEVTIEVDADVDDVIHVHGYELHQDVAAGEKAEVTFTADIAGVFKVELEDRGMTLVELEVR